MADRSYSAAIDALNSLQSNAATIEAIRRSGKTVNELNEPEMVEYLERIGHKQDELNKINVLHITGTKGKGSTSAFCDSLLRQVRPQGAGPIGLYTSPHMVAARERIRIDGVPLSEADFARFFWEVWDRLGENTQRKFETTPLRPVYFRYMTILAMHTFISLNVSATILEVGIGGLYDSTNIVPKPVVTGVSALGIDHTFILGNTIEEIAFQKGGIYKAGAPALTVEQPESAINVLRECAEKAKSSSFEVVSSSSVGDVPLGLPGAHQRSNAALALAMVRAFVSSDTGKTLYPGAAEALTSEGGELPPAALSGLANAFWPGRCQTVPTAGPTYYLDGAHTVESIQCAVRWFVEQARDARRGLIFNCTNGRSAELLLGTFLDEIKRHSDASPSSFFSQVCFCTNNTYANGGSASDLVSRAIDSDDLEKMTVQRELLAAWSRLLDIPSSELKLEAQDTVAEALPSIEHAIGRMRDQNIDSVFVCGSLHLVGGVMAHLQEQGALDEQLHATSHPFPSAKSFPASFVLPSNVPKVTRIVDAEAQQRRELLELFENLKLPHTHFAFAYGSGVFAQAAAHDKSKKMIDLILAVQNPELWHARNLALHPHHYPWIVRILGSWGINKIQHLGGGLWYNPYVSAGDRMVKYGVTSLDNLCNDLIDWDTLYIAGRLHKPVAKLVDTTDGRASLAMQVNLTSAIRVALLLLPEEFSERDLYLKMAELSYIGDFRMRVPGGENANKIRNIVDNQGSLFRIMCADLVMRLGSVKITASSDDAWAALSQDTSTLTRAQLASRLPLNLRRHLMKHYVDNAQQVAVFKEAKDADLHASMARIPDQVKHDDTLMSRFWSAVVEQPDFQDVLLLKVAEIVSRPARIQSLKGIYTAGFTRSIRYVWAKITKYWEGKRQK
ncbi:tetrahydrofolate synthase [Malassezia cuniculi]|uniref:tetrahydrofolate synthase n=1 Tax=Malassezia cuniculi TaxID=948313 RepID=A0AAF0ET27_9BASI|nr:tetrahydrofolate synthase [Malassezia cuniculi]